MDLGQKTYTARQLLGLLERETILRGRLPMFSELAYQSEGPSVDTYLDVLGDGDWNSLQSGLSAWLGARGYQIDRDGKLVAKLPPVAKPAAVSGKPVPAKEAPPAQKKKPLPPPKPRTLKAIGSETAEQDWSRLKPDQLLAECQRSLNKRFPQHTASGQNAVGHKLVNALMGMLGGQAISIEDGRQLVRTLLQLIFPEAAINQLTISPLFWREDPLGGLIAKANLHLYGEDGLYPIADAVEKLAIGYADLADLLAHNDLTLVFTRSYGLIRHDVDAILQARRGP